LITASSIVGLPRVENIEVLLSGILGQVNMAMQTIIAITKNIIKIASGVGIFLFILSFYQKTASIKRWFLFGSEDGTILELGLLRILELKHQLLPF
jgi:hypothetical protein